MPKSLQDIETLLKEAGVEDREVMALADELNEVMSDSVVIPDEFRRRLKEELLTTAAQNKALVSKRRGVPAWHRYAGVAAATLIFVGGISFYLNQDQAGGPSVADNPPAAGGDMGMMAGPDQPDEPTGIATEQGVPTGSAPQQVPQASPLPVLILEEPEDTGQKPGGNNPINREQAVQLAKEQVPYPAAVLEVRLERDNDGQPHWYVSLIRDGVGIPHRDNFVIDAHTGAITHELSAQ